MGGGVHNISSFPNIFQTHFIEVIRKTCHTISPTPIFTLTALHTTHEFSWADGMTDWNSAHGGNTQDSGTHARFRSIDTQLTTRMTRWSKHTYIVYSNGYYWSVWLHFDLFWGPCLYRDVHLHWSHLELQIGATMLTWTRRAQRPTINTNQLYCTVRRHRTLLQAFPEFTAFTALHYIVKYKCNIHPKAEAFHFFNVKYCSSRNLCSQHKTYFYISI